MKAFLRRHWLAESIIFLIFGFIAFSYVQLKRPVPDVDTTEVQQPQAAQAAQGPDAQLAIPWPANGNTAVAVQGAGLVGASHDERPRPIASLVKVMTAYVILKDHPLTLGEHGPAVDIQQADVDTYLGQRANGESVVAVKAGTQLSEQDLLEGMLVPSGNNLAFTLANWDSGSIEAFVGRMNQEAKALGMKDTAYADPSGASSSSHSTARDQLKLAEAAMAMPAFAAFVGEKQVSLPVAGILYNVNNLIGKNGVSGIKTGWTDDAGACFILSFDSVVDGKPVSILAATLGQDTLADAFTATRNSAQAVAANLQMLTPVSKDATAAAIKSSWGKQVDAGPAQDVSLLVWPGMAVSTQFTPADLSNEVKKGQEIGKLVVTAGNQRQEVPVVAKGKITKAGLKWRLSRLL